MFIVWIVVGFLGGLGFGAVRRRALSLRAHVLAELRCGMGTALDLCSRIELAHGYRPSIGSIYPLLRKMESEGALALCVEPGGAGRGGRQRYIYSIPKMAYAGCTGGYALAKVLDASPENTAERTAEIEARAATIYAGLDYDGSGEMLAGGLGTRQGAYGSTCRPSCARPQRHSLRKAASSLHKRQHSSSAMPG